MHTTRAIGLLAAALGLALGLGLGLAAALPAATSQHSQGHSRMLVQIFYESLCPYSIQLLTTQVPRAYNLTGPDWVTMELVPFGKAKVFPSGEGFAFRCQHGGRECYGNKLQACAFARLTGKNPDQVKFTICAMGAADPSNPPDQCATDVGLSAEELRTCASGEEGQLLLRSYGAITPDMVYKSGIPLVLVDKEPSFENQDIVQNDLVDFFCQKFWDMQNGMPEGCSYA